jgi:hypothetical protein
VGLLIGESTWSSGLGRDAWLIGAWDWPSAVAEWDQTCCFYWIRRGNQAGGGAMSPARDWVRKAFGSDWAASSRS